jgi:hypothetical protein
LLYLHLEICPVTFEIIITENNALDTES